MNLARKLPPMPLLLPASALVLAALLLIATLLVQGKSLRDSAGALAPVTQSAAADKDAPLPPAAPPSNLGLLANSELFGHYDPTKAAAGNAQQAAPKTTAELGDKPPDALPEASLALKLQGIVYKKDPSQRRAIIAGDGPSSEARKIGETLLGDAVIRYIEARRVVVEQQGELKALTLLDPPLGGDGMAPGNVGPSTSPLPGGSPSAYVAQPPQAMRRGAMGAVPDQPAEEPVDAQYEPPPDEIDTSTDYEEPPPVDDAGDAGVIDQTEPTE